MKPNKLPFVLVGIAGGLNTGKGTVAEEFKRNGYLEKNFADPLKRMVRELFNVPTSVLWGPSENRTPIVRQMLQELGTDYARKFRPTIWVDKMEEALSAFASAGLKGYRGIVISDVRFLNEIECIHEMGGIVIRVDRPGNASHLDNSLAQHSSETEIASLPLDTFDYIILNNGTLEDLQAKICKVVKALSTPNLCE